MNPSVLRVLFAIIVVGVPLRAQVIDPSVGARVRVSWSAPSQPTLSRTPAIGTLVRSTRDSVVVRPAFRAEEVAIARDAIGSMEISGGVSRQRSAIWRGALGALIWAGFSYVGDRGVPSPKRGAQAMAWGAAGATFGGIWGWRSPGERWRRVTP